MQFIKPDGSKKFLGGGRIKGCYFKIKGKELIVYIAEGYATAASIAEATGSEVYVCFNAGNLYEVASYVTKQHPSSKVIIAGDNDKFNDINVGANKSTQAAEGLGIEVILPSFEAKYDDNRPTDFNDYANIYGIKELKNLLEQNLELPTKEWGEPVLFGEHNLPEIKAEYLPQPYKDFAAYLADNSETPQSMAVLSILAVIATALQGKFVIKPKLDDDYKETLNIYTMTVLPPANRKTSVLNACIKPLVDWEKEQKKKIEPEVKKKWSEYECKKKIIANKRASLKNNIDDILINEIATLEASLKEPDGLPRLFVNDATLESLAIIIEKQKGRMAILSDEGGILDVVGGLYSGGKVNIDLLLKGWDGGYFNQIRKDRELCLNPFLTINILAQPKIIENMAKVAGFDGKGLLERFLYCLPESYLGYRTNDKPPIPEIIKKAYSDEINKLLSILYPLDNEDSCPEEPKTLILDNDALEEWQAFQQSIELDLRPNGRLYPCLGWAGKICGYTLRIAGLLHVAEYGADTPTINQATMDRALSIASCLTYHSLAAFDLMAITEEVRLAKSVFNWIAAQEQLQFKKADLTTAMRKRAKVDKLNDVIKELTERNLIREAGKDGKTIYYEINPNCLDRGL